MLLTLLGVELSMMILFVLNETMWAKDPLIPFRLIKANGAGFICLAQCCTNFLFWGYEKSNMCSLQVYFWRLIMLLKVALERH